MTVRIPWNRIVKLSISLAFFFADRLIRSTGGNPSGRTSVLYFHDLPDFLRSRFGANLDRIRRAGIVTLGYGELDAAPAAGDRCLITFDDGFESVVRNGLPELCKRSIPCAIFVTTGSLGNRPRWVKSERHPFWSERVIDRAQLKTLSENPLVSIGSHGVRHCDSNKLTDAEFELEIAESKRALEEGTGRGVDSFSFPHGEFSGRHLEILSRHGYRRAFSISPETAPAKGTSFIYGRFHCSGREWPLEFLLKASGAYRWLGTISRIKGLMFNKTGNRT